MAEYPIIGMSPGNSYFKDEVVERLLKSVVEKFGKAAILIADIPAVSTYIALGYPKNRAWRDKALPQSNNLKNKVARAMNKLGYTDRQVKIINWGEEIENSFDYRERYSEVFTLYKTNTIFKKDADDTTREVLEISGKEIKDFDGATEVAVHYLLSEIAFMEFAPKYLNADKVTYVYHKNWPVYEKYIAGEFDSIPRTQLAFLVL